MTAFLTAEVQVLQSQVLAQHLGQLCRTLDSDNVTCATSTTNCIELS